MQSERGNLFVLLRIINDVVSTAKVTG